MTKKGFFVQAQFTGVKYIPSYRNHEIEILDGEKVKVTASFGIATFAEDGISPDDLLVKADEMLYKAKKDGKNRVVYQ